MSSKKSQAAPNSPRTAYAIMIAGAIAVMALVGWALNRSFNAPAAAPALVPSAPVSSSPPAPPPASAADEEAARAAVPRISVEDLHQRVLEQKVTLVDVRDQASFESGHIRGAMHIPLASVESYLSFVPRDKPIVTYCT